MIDSLTNPCYCCEKRHYLCHKDCEKYIISLEIRAAKKAIENAEKSKDRPFYTDAETKRHYKSLKHNGRMRKNQ